MAAQLTAAQVQAELTALQQQIANLQAAQTNLSANQVQQIVVRALQQAQQPVAPAPFDPGVNTILTAHARLADPNTPDVINEDNPPPPGAPNIKGTKPPLAFLGTKEDARPFVDRVDAWFMLVPTTYRLTKSRILATCSLILTHPADSWAIMVSNTIACQQDTGYYYDNWEEFKEDFIRSFSITNEHEEARMQLVRITQGTMELSTFTAEFLRLKERSQMLDKAAVHKYRRVLHPPLTLGTNLSFPVWYTANTLQVNGQCSCDIPIWYITSTFRIF